MKRVAIILIIMLLVGCESLPSPTELPPPIEPTQIETNTPNTAEPNEEETTSPINALLPTVESGTFFLEPLADAVVNNNQADENFGSSLTLEADSEPDTKRILLRFALPQLAESVRIDSAQLALYVHDASPDGGSVYLIDDEWDEQSVTWNNAPPIGDFIVNFDPATDLDVWNIADVTSVITAGQTISFYVISNAEDGVDYQARENTFAPRLIVEWQTGNPLTEGGSDNQPRVDGDIPVLIGAGDIATCDPDDNDEMTARLLETIAGTVFTTGDGAYPSGSLEQYQSCYDPTWGRLREHTRPSPGNHDYGTPNANGYFAYYGDLAGPPGLGYYSYDLGSWHILSLNSNCGYVDVCDPDSDQFQWLRADLEANATDCMVAYFHHPLFSSGARHGGNEAVKPLWDVLYAYGVDVIINGHEHFYERFAPQSPDGEATEEGIRQFTVGSGGRSLYNFVSTPHPNSEIRFNEAYGVLKLELHPGSYTWEYLTVEGSSFTDTGEGACTTP